MRSLQERLLDVPQVGRVAWIGLRPDHGEPVHEVEAVRALVGHGLEGDVAARGRGGGKRQVSLVQAEHLPVIAALTGVAQVTPAMLRRNLLIAGVNLLALVRLRFAVGDQVVLVGTGACAPCSVMDESVAAGAFQAMRGHGGITASVERAGWIRVGDLVRVV